MIGRLLGGVVRVATLPLSVANVAMDVASGGDGSKRSRTASAADGNPIAALEKAGERAAEAVESLDD